MIDCGDAHVECVECIKYDDEKDLRGIEQSLINANDCVNGWNYDDIVHEDGIYYGSYLPPPKPLTVAQKLARQCNHERRQKKRALEGTWV